jgi:uncharacterized protein (TIGR02246 family)
MRATTCIIGLLLMVGVPGTLRPQQGPADPNVRQKIVLATLALDSAYRRGDANALAALLTEDAILSFVGAEDVQGRAAIRAFFAEVFAVWTYSALQLQPGEIEVCGTRAYDRGTILGTAARRGGPLSTVRGRYFAVWTRGDDGVWRLHRFHENHLPAPG